MSRRCLSRRTACQKFRELLYPYIIADGKAINDLGYEDTWFQKVMDLDSFFNDYFLSSQRLMGSVRRIFSFQYLVD